MAEKVEALFKKTTTLLKVNSERRKTPAHQKNMTGFMDKLEKTAPFWPQDVLKRVKNEKD